jgi:hypothetical protein
MKTTPTILACLLGGMALAQAQSNWGTAAPVTVTLTVSSTAPGTVAKDSTGRPLTGNAAAPAYSNEFQVNTVRNGVTTRSVATREYLSKQSSFRWGNAQIILALVQSETLPRKGRFPHTAGWSLMRITSNAPTGEQTISYFARHTDKTAVALDDIGLAVNAAIAQSEISASTVTEREVTTTVFDLTGGNNDITTTSLTYTSSLKAIGVGYGALGVELPGLLTASYRNVVKTERVVDPQFGTTTFSTNIMLPGVLRLDRIVAHKPLASDGTADVPGLIEGSISTAAATVQNLDTYLVAPQAP